MSGFDSPWQEPPALDDEAVVNNDLLTAELNARQAIEALERAIALMPRDERWGYARVAATRLRGVKTHYIDPIQPGVADKLNKLAREAEREALDKSLTEIQLLLEPGSQ